MSMGQICELRDIGGGLCGIFLNGQPLPYVLALGPGLPLTGATNPLIAKSAGFNNYIQSYMYNTTNGVSSSSDYVAYVSNSSDSHGWADMGMTSAAYNDSTYTCTGPNEAYLLGSGPTGTTGTGNLVFATDNTGSANSFQWYPGGFTQAKTSYKMQLDQLGNFYLKPPATPPTLAVNGDMVMNLTSNTNLRISVRGTDGVTRVNNLTLA